MLAGLIPSVSNATEDPLNSLQSLVNTNITSVSKQEEPASKAAASVYVINAEDIQRSGATTIPDVLRMVPGVNVGRSSSHEWAVSVRGFNDQFANKLLVVLDGRTLYTPLFSGVFWDAQHMMLENIERIEVIRGPGASLWGANAVNGVINIITKKAAKTQGTFIRTHAGNAEAGAAIRQGNRTAEGDYRVYADSSAFGAGELTSGGSAHDDWWRSQAGFRYDHTANPTLQTTLQGDYYEGGMESNRHFPDRNAVSNTSIIPSHTRIRGGNMLAKAEKRGDNGAQTTSRVFADYAYRDIQSVGTHSIVMLDSEVQHDFATLGDHQFSVGGSYRLVDDQLAGTPYLHFSPDERTTHLFGTFIQDKITLSDTTNLTLGTKLEHNDYTGMEIQPSARIAYSPDDSTTLWASVARAVRTPTRSSDDVRLLQTVAAVGTSSAYVQVAGDNDGKAEELTAYELGLRKRYSDTLVFDTSLFYNDYDSLFAFAPGIPTLNTTLFTTPVPIIPAFGRNLSTGTAYGGEASAHWAVQSNWRLIMGYSYLNIDLDGAPSFVSSQDSAPRHQFSLRSQWDVTPELSFDQAVYSYGALEDEDTAGHVRADMRLGWEPQRGLSLALVGQNLLYDHRKEFSPFLYTGSTAFGRSILGRVAVEF